MSIEDPCRMPDVVKPETIQSGLMWYPRAKANGIDT